MTAPDVTPKPGCVYFGQERGCPEPGRCARRVTCPFPSTTSDRREPCMAPAGLITTPLRKEAATDAASP